MKCAPAILVYNGIILPGRLHIGCCAVLWQLQVRCRAAGSARGTLRTLQVTQLHQYTTLVEACDGALNHCPAQHHVLGTVPGVAQLRGSNQQASC